MRILFLVFTILLVPGQSAAVEDSATSLLPLEQRLKIFNEIICGGWICDGILPFEIRTVRTDQWECKIVETSGEHHTNRLFVWPISDSEHDSYKLHCLYETIRYEAFGTRRPHSCTAEHTALLAEEMRIWSTMLNSDAEHDHLFETSDDKAILQELGTLADRLCLKQ